MIQFTTQLKKGIYIKDVPKSYKNLVDYLISIKALKGKKTLKLTSDYIVGSIDINSKGVGFITPNTGKKDLLIEPKDLEGAKKGDLVIAKRIFSRNSRPKAKVIVLLKKQFETIVGYLSLKDLTVRNIKTDQEIKTNIKPKQLKKLANNTVFKLNAYTYEIEEILGNLDDPLVDEKISLALYNKEERFPKKAIIEAQSFGNYVNKTLYARADLTHLSFCTIDPETAKDHDDAIYYDINEKTLYVAIADVSEYVYLNSAIDKEAIKRGFSIYFPHKSIPMLPRELSENICSLKENEDRLSLIFKITFDENNNVINEELIEGIINSKRKYSYNQIDEFLEGRGKKDKIDEEILKWLFPLFEITKILKQERLQNGLEFFSDEIKMTLDEEGKLQKVKIESETPSHRLIEDCMLLANKAAAKMIDFGIFRVHNEPQKKDIQNLLKELLPLGISVNYKNSVIDTLKKVQKKAKELGIEKYVDKMIIKTQQQAKYEAYNNGHFALGFEKYTHFTSPIRRYSDLILHRLLKSILHNNQKFREFILRNIESLVVKISELEREAMKIEWDFYDRKFARWANEKIGKIVKATVIDTKDPPIAKIEDEIVGARIFLKRKKVNLFEKVNVKIVNVNIATTKIKGAIIENKS
jgi:ribonuclease R